MSRDAIRAFAACALLAVAVPARAGAVGPALERALARVGPEDRLPILLRVRVEEPDRLPAPRAFLVARARARMATAVSRLRPVLSRLERGGELSGLQRSWAGGAIGAWATADAVRELAAAPEVEEVTFDPPRPALLVETRPGPAGGDSFRGRLDLPEDDHSRGIDAGVVRIGAPEVWQRFGLDGRGVVVAVVDSGVCPEHPGIAGRLWVNPGEDRDGDRVPLDPDDLDGVDGDGNGFVDDLIGWDFAEDDPYPDDATGHGSHVAGTVSGDGAGGGFRAGAAPGASVMVLRVPARTTRQIDVLRALDYAAVQGADIVNLSLGWRAEWGPDRAAWRRAADRLRAMGVTVVAAAGNEGWGREPVNVRTPADVPGVVGVGATDPADRPAVFSSRGPVGWQDVPGFGDHPWPPGLAKPDLSAPGVDTRSHALCEGTADESGTSMAAPHVSGAAALLLEADPRLAPDDLRTLLAGTAVDVAAPGPDLDTGAGRIDVLEAVEAIAPRYAISGWRVDDGGDPGDGDGVAEPGEHVALVVEIQRLGTDPGEQVHGRLVVLDGPASVTAAGASWGRVEPGAPATADRPFRVAFGGPCGSRVRFALDVTDVTGRRSRLPLDLRTGHREAAVLFADDFERERGWQVSSDAVAGSFVRVRPRGTSFKGRWANPPSDAGGGEGFAYVTGNGGASALDDDLDGGATTLRSPVLDASRFVALELRWTRWYARSGRPGWPALEGLVAEASPDGGRTWVLLEATGLDEPAWRPRSVALEELFDPLPARLVVRFRAAAADGEQGGDDVLIEAGIDDVRLAGARASCE